MSNFYYVKLSCPKNYNGDNGKFYEILKNWREEKAFSEELTNIPNNLSNASDGDFVFLQLGGDSSNKRKYLYQAGDTDNTGFKNGLYAIGLIKSREPNNKLFTARFYPFNKVITKLDLYLYPQFIDNLGCITKGIPNQAGLYQLDEETSYGFIEYLLINNFSGKATKKLNKIRQKDSLRDSAKRFYDRKNLLTLPSSDIIKNLLVPESDVKAKVNIKSDSLNFEINNFISNIREVNFICLENLASRFVSALQTKPFVILTGLSGSGKTKLAEAFSMWINENKNQTCMVSVGADWTNREALLGFPNALEQGQYIKPDSGALDLIINAQNDLTRPYFLILDEMNMSHVERYFADFLSAMESVKGEITLHPDTPEWDGCDVPAKVSLPNNLFIIGTVNIDETTYMFSPKVLDRANVIEFRVSADEMRGYLESPTELNLSALAGVGASMAESFVAKANEKGLTADNLEDSLMPFFEQLQNAGAEFGYRTASEISRFVKICTDLADGSMTEDEVVDAAIIQKLLPKLHGSRNKIEKILNVLAGLCLHVDEKAAPFSNIEGSDIKYALSYEKLARMHRRVIADGFTSFAEA